MWYKLLWLIYDWWFHYLCLLFENLHIILFHSGFMIYCEVLATMDLVCVGYLVFDYMNIMSYFRTSSNIFFFHWQSCFFFFPFFCLNFAGWSSKRAKNYKAMWICCQEPYSGSKGDFFFIFYLALPNIFFSSHAISARESLEEKWNIYKLPVRLLS